jgi:hypothetical protein
MSSILNLQYRNLPFWERGVIKQKTVTTGYTIAQHAKYAVWNKKAYTTTLLHH